MYIHIYIYVIDISYPILYTYRQMCMSPEIGCPDQPAAIALRSQVSDVFVALVPRLHHRDTGQLCDLKSYLTRDPCWFGKSTRKLTWQETPKQRGAVGGFLIYNNVDDDDADNDDDGGDDDGDGDDDDDVSDNDVEDDEVEDGEVQEDNVQDDEDDDDGDDDDGDDDDVGVDDDDDAEKEEDDYCLR